jgi:putative transposase
MIDALQRHPIRILSYCILSNHWHFVVWPHADGDLSNYFRWLAHTHAIRWRVSHRTVGYGHVYHGRFKSFPIQSDDHLLTVCRYVERNPLAAGLVRRAQLWRWGSLWTMTHGDDAIKALLSPWPVQRPDDWIDRVNAALTAKELNRVRVSIDRGRPYGGDAWVKRTVRELHLQHTVRSEGRPRAPGKLSSSKRD